MNTTKPEKPNPFRQSLHRKLRGQYTTPSIESDRHIMQHEQAVEFERHRWQAIVEARTEWHPEF